MPTVPQSIQEQIQMLEPSAVIELFQLHLTLAVNGTDTVYYYHAGTNEIYGDIVFDNLLLDIKSVVEKITNKKLIEQYSYLRLYSPGDVMYKHKDRNSCEYSVSLCIDSNLITLYPLMVEDKNKQINAVCLEPGSAVVYAGTELVHWRDMFLGKYLAQVFLHYVDADGPYKDQKYDGRKSLGKSFTTKCL